MTDVDAVRRIAGHLMGNGAQANVDAGDAGLSAGLHDGAVAPRTRVSNMKELGA
jgi:hypothetical protein